jgi:hypothetical protein
VEHTFRVLEHRAARELTKTAGCPSAPEKSVIGTPIA